jgi:hypothetical protein
MREVIDYSMGYRCRAYGRLAGPRNSAAGRLSLLLRHDFGMISSNLSTRLASHRLATSICCGAHLRRFAGERLIEFDHHIENVLFMS